MKLFGIWHDAAPPLELTASWLDANPDAEGRVYTFAEIEPVMRDEFPEVARVYDAAEFPNHRSNILRVVALALWGGIYLDLDVECLRPFGELADRDLLLTSEGPTATNAVLGTSRPRHPFFLGLLDLQAQQRRPRSAHDAKMTSGIWLLTHYARTVEKLDLFGDGTLLHLSGRKHS